jgi:hypothetical protein
MHSDCATLTQVIKGDASCLVSHFLTSIALMKRENSTEPPGRAQQRPRTEPATSWVVTHVQHTENDLNDISVSNSVFMRKSEAQYYMLKKANERKQELEDGFYSPSDGKIIIGGGTLEEPESWDVYTLEKVTSNCDVCEEDE